MSKTRSHLFYDLDHGRPVEEAHADRNELHAWTYLPPRRTSGTEVSDLDCSSEMATSPGHCLSNSQSSWDSNDLIHQRTYSESADGSPLSISSLPSHMNGDLFRGEVHLVMRTPPEPRFRYRYDTEMSGTHGSLQGVRLGREKSVPTVELVNFPFEAIIRVTLVTCSENGERHPHPHNLFVKEKMYQKNIYLTRGKKVLTKTGHYADPHYIRVGSNKNDYIAKFEGMCIISSKKENFHSSIKEKLYLRDSELKRSGGDLLWPGKKEEIIKKVEAVARFVDVDFVSLCFEAFQEDEEGKLIPLCQPLYSGPIGNAKSAKTGKLKIARINKCTGSCKGGDEIWLLVEKINKKGLVIKFTEIYEGRIVWEACVGGDDLILHHQYAIIFKTPPYRDPNISSEVEVLMRLERASQLSQCDDYSEPMTFVYEPMRNRNSRNDNLHRKESILTPLKQLQHKRPRTDSSSSASTYNFQSKRRPDELEFFHNSSFDEVFSDIEQILQENKMDPFDPWSKFNVDEFLQFMSSDNMDMALQKDSVGQNTKQRGFNLICKLLLLYSKMNENDIKKLTEQISNFQFSKRDKIENKNGFEKEMVEDAASTLLSLRSRVVENNNTDSDNKNVVEITLHEAIRRNRPEVVSLKLKEGASCSQQDKHGNTPLHLSLLHKFDGCTEQILRSQDSFKEFINLKNNEGRAPVHIATENGNMDCLKKLISIGANVHETETKTKRNILHIAASKGHKHIIEYLLQSTDISLNVPDGNGQIPSDIINRLGAPQRQELADLFKSKIVKIEPSPFSPLGSDSFIKFKEARMEEVYQLLNNSGSWRKLAEMWDCAFMISHAESLKNPAKNIFASAEQKHGKQGIEAIRVLLEEINETKAVKVLDEISAKKFM